MAAGNIDNLSGISFLLLVPDVLDTSIATKYTCIMEDEGFETSVKHKCGIIANHHRNLG